MKLRGIDRISDILNDYLEQFDLTACLSDCFAIELEEGVIQYTLFDEPTAARCFMDFCHSINPYVNCDNFLISLFHEIGHKFTYDDFSDNTLDRSEHVKDFANKLYKIAPTMANRIYFNLPEEKAATEWGLNYIETHAEEVAALWTRLQDAIMHFYLVNGVDISEE